MGEWQWERCIQEVIFVVMEFKLVIEMAEALQQVYVESTSTKKRKSYSREQKLKVVNSISRYIRTTTNIIFYYSMLFGWLLFLRVLYADMVIAMQIA